MMMVLEWYNQWKFYAFLKYSYRPKRTLRVVLYMNEENGQRGAAKYADVAKRNNEQHVFALESDAGGYTTWFFD